MNNKYTLCTHDEPSMEVRKFTWYLDEANNAVLEWEWPTERNVKFMIIVEYGENEPDIARILEEEKGQTVVTRNLAARYQTPLPNERVRYMIYPAYFEGENTIMVYEPGYSTDWMYKKNQISAYATYKSIPMSRHQQVTLVVEFPEPLFEPEALWYGIYEEDRLLGRYPMDKGILEGSYSFYIKKNQEVKFTVDENYIHALELQE